MFVDLFVGWFIHLFNIRPLAAIQVGGWHCANLVNVALYKHFSGLKLQYQTKHTKLL